MSIYSFEKLYKDYHRDVLAFIYVIARKDPYYADDIFQNTMESAYLNFKRLDSPDKGKSWLFAIAKREASRYFHRNKKHLFPNTESVNAIEEAASEPDLSIDIIDSDAFVNAVKTLSENEQSIMTLYLYYDMQLKDIAKMTNQNKNTVKSIYRRSLTKLKSVFEKEGYGFE